MAGENDTNGKTCDWCGKPLVGRQQRFCSNSHRSAWGRKHRKQTESKTPTGSATNALVTIENLKGEIARAESIAAVYLEENTRLQRQLTDATESRISAESRAAELSGRLDSQLLVRRILYAAVALLLVGLIALAVVLALSV